MDLLGLILQLTRQLVRKREAPRPPTAATETIAAGEEREVGSESFCTSSGSASTGMPAPIGPAHPAAVSRSRR